MGSLSVTWDEHYREPFAPLVPGVTFVVAERPGRARRGRRPPTTAAIIVEPIQGEGGVRPIPPAIGARHRATRAIATGALAHRRRGAVRLGPDRRSVYSQRARPGAGSRRARQGARRPACRSGAALFSQRVADKAAPGDHGTTYGGNLLACRAALVFLDALIEGGVMTHVAEAGRHVRARLEALAAKHRAIVEVRGAGLIWGLELDRDATPVIEAAFERRLLVNRTAGTVVRLLPALTISTADLDEGIARLDEAFAACKLS